jgi:hypothetical protein
MRRQIVVLHVQSNGCSCKAGLHATHACGHNFAIFSKGFAHQYGVLSVFRGKVSLCASAAFDAFAESG